MMFTSIGMEAILFPRNEYAYTDGERTIKCKDLNIKCFRSHGAERYIYYIDGLAVSGLELGVNNYAQMYVRNVYTLPEFRRQGYAKKIWAEAKLKHTTVFHSTNLSEDGRIFAAHCK